MRLICTLAFAAIIHALTLLPSSGEAPLLLGPLSKEQIQAGWIQLMAPQDHFGWTATGGSEWRVDDSADAVAEGDKPGWLMTTTEWSDFELTLEFRCVDRDANSGVFLRTSLNPKDPQKDCYEVNIAPVDDPFPTGSIVGRMKAQATEGIAPTGEDGFRKLRIVAQGDNVRVELDGQLVADYIDPAPLAKGHIGLQHNSGKFQFRKILLKPLGTKPLMDRASLAGWNDELAGPATFDLTPDGELLVKGGPGQLESRSRHGDFVLQFECKVNGDALNSGVFFRSIPGDKMNGYECQIQNGYKEGDRTKPADFGTGAIYRRVPARRVNANDHEWFTTTLHANGPHIAVWVNGLQVTDWRDTRDPHDNPRQGLRLTPGTFCLQAHDPTTDLAFRNFRIAELPSIDSSESE